MRHFVPKSLADYDYPLPAEQIAQFPLEQRDQSRLLIYRNGALQETIFAHLADHLPAQSHLVFNDSKVIPARLSMHTPTGARVECLLLEPACTSNKCGEALQAHPPVTWRCLVKNIRRLRRSAQLVQREMGEEELELSAELLARDESTAVMQFDWTPKQLTFADVLDRIGQVPLPPYIKRPQQATDRDRYQTIYGHSPGSVASPTAGLHFTNEVMKRLAAKAIDSHYLTLHVGGGTFLPIKSDTIEAHSMHAEQVCVSRTLIELLLRNRQQPQADRGPWVAVGTTCLRSLESLYWLGHALLNGQNKLYVDQWAGNQMDACIPPETCLSALINELDRQQKQQLHFTTRLMIVPGYRFQLTDALITNFHLPRTTLIMLVAAFIGPDWRIVYDYALQHGFRFLSYGDASLLWRTP